MYFANRSRIETVGVGQDERELLAADPGEVVDLALHGAGDGREALERLVADAVAEAVVDRLEVIEIHHQHRHRAASALRAFDLGLQPVEPFASRCRAGEEINDAGLTKRVNFMRRA